MSADIANHLHLQILFLHIFQCFLNFQLPAVQADNQPPERHALDIIQAAEKNAHIQIKILDEPADNRLIGRFPDI